MLKPLESKEERDKKIKKRNLFLGVIIAIVMIGGTVGWAFLSGDTGNVGQKNYNGFNFVQTENYWQTQIDLQGQKFLLQTSFLPGEVENVTSNFGNLDLNSFAGKGVYIIANFPGERQAAIEFAINLQNLLNRVQFACLKEDANESFCIDKPIKSCEDADQNTAIITIHESEDINSTTIDYNSGCLTIAGTAGDVIRAMDKGIFSMFGVIK